MKRTFFFKTPLQSFKMAKLIAQKIKNNNLALDYILNPEVNPNTSLS